MSQFYFSPYRLTWIEFRAQKGAVLRKDARLLLQSSYVPIRTLGDRIFLPFANREQAECYLLTLDVSSLSKHYEVRLCCDKQFSLGHIEGRSNIVKYTKKQEAAMFVL